MKRLSSEERGQASVEFVAVVPFVLLAALVAWQFALAGHVAWTAAGAARAGARAALVGRDPASAARSALPRSLRSATRVSQPAGGGVRVSVPIPLVIYTWRTPVRVSASASLGR
jgi:hypothetical protein